MVDLSLFHLPFFTGHMRRTIYVPLLFFFVLQSDSPNSIQSRRLDGRSPEHPIAENRFAMPNSLFMPMSTGNCVLGPLSTCAYRAH